MRLPSSSLQLGRECNAIQQHELKMARTTNQRRGTKVIARTSTTYIIRIYPNVVRIARRPLLLLKTSYQDNRNGLSFLCCEKPQSKSPAADLCRGLNTEEVTLPIYCFTAYFVGVLAKELTPKPARACGRGGNKYNMHHRRTGL